MESETETESERVESKRGEKERDRDRDREGGRERMGRDGEFSGKKSARRRRDRGCSPQSSDSSSSPTSSPFVKFRGDSHAHTLPQLPEDGDEDNLLLSPSLSLTPLPPPSPSSLPCVWSSCASIYKTTVCMHTAHFKKVALFLITAFAILLSHTNVGASSCEF